MKEIVIYEFQLKEILEALRLTKRIHETSQDQTAFDRTVNQAYKYAENAIANKKETVVRFGKNVENGL